MCKHFGDERIAISFWNRVARRKRHVKIACVNEAIESVHQGVLRWFSDLASAENSVKKRTQFFSLHKTGTRSSKFVFYARTPNDMKETKRYGGSIDIIVYT